MTFFTRVLPVWRPADCKHGRAGEQGYVFPFITYTPCPTFRIFCFKLHTMAGFVCMRRLVRLNSNRALFLNVHKCKGEIRTFFANSVNYKEAEGDNSNLSPKLASRLTLLSRRRRSLSPLERISGLLPQDALSPEVMQLRDLNETDTTAETEPLETCLIQEDCGPSEDDLDTHEDPKPPGVHSDVTFREEESCPSVPGERLLGFGELLVAEYSKKRRVEFKKLFQLQSGARLMGNWGFIQHNDIVGKRAGQFLKTGRGVPIFIRRASLEDYVLLMRRGPAIAYPKVRMSVGYDVCCVWEWRRQTSVFPRMLPPCWWWWMWQKETVYWSQAQGPGPWLCSCPEQVRNCLRIKVALNHSVIRFPIKSNVSKQDGYIFIHHIY